jgi:cysteinyl-tRNA synthetase
VQATASPAADDFARRFHAAMDDDFNTPVAMSVLAELRHALNKAKGENDTVRAAQLAGRLIQLGGLLGLLQDDADAFLKGAVQAGAVSEELDTEHIEKLIEQRNNARREKNWSEADRLRDELAARGVVLEDSAGGTLWRRE